MEPELTNQKKAAPPVEEKTQNTVEPFDIEGIKKKIPKAFQGYIEPIIQWAKSVEDRLQVIGNVTPESIAAELQKLAIQRQKEQQAAYQAQPQGPPQQGGGFDMSSIMPIIAQAVGGGGGSYDEEMQAITKDIMRANLDRMKRDSSFMEAITSAIVTKIAGKAASDIVGVV